MADPFIGEVRIFAGNFAPRDWAFCDGQTIQISQNPALFSILGATYGGDGRTTFGVPNLQGRAPMHAGQGPGLTRRSLGERGGVDQVTLGVGDIPSHTHALQGANAVGDQASPVGNAFAQSPTGRQGFFLYDNDDNTGAMDSNILASTGSQGPHNNLQPYLVLQFIIALQGTFPSRS